jgi:hypothetical protein
LGEVYWGNVALLERFEGLGKFAFEFGEELATGDLGGIGGAGAADEDDGRGEGVCANADRSSSAFLLAKYHQS